MSDGRKVLVERVAGLLPAEGTVLVLDLPELEELLGATRCTSESPPITHRGSPSAEREPPPGGPVPVAAAVIGGSEEELILVARRVRALLPTGAVLGMIFPVPQAGWRGAASRALSWTAKAARRPRPLEEISTAMLAAGAGPIRIERAKDLVLAWGQIRPRPV